MLTAGRLRHTRGSRGRGRAGGAERGEAARRGNCQPSHCGQLVAMTTPSCVVPRNKLLIANTAFPPARSPQCPLGCRHSSPLLHLICIWLKEDANRNLETSQAPKPLPSPLCLPPPSHPGCPRHPSQAEPRPPKLFR